MTAQAGDTLSERERLRAQARSARKALSVPARRIKARQAATAARHLIRRYRARRVAAFVAHASEIPTNPLVAALHTLGVAVFLPVVTYDGRMRFREWRGERLHPGAFGIPQPRRGRYIFRADLDIVLLPLLAFDAQGTRLGAGGGFYDRWLADARGPRPLRCGYAFAAQECPHIRREPWDIPLHAVVTENGWRLLNR